MCTVGAGSKDRGLRPLKKDPCGLQKNAAESLIGILGFLVVENEGHWEEKRRLSLQGQGPESLKTVLRLLACA